MFESKLFKYLRIIIHRPWDRTYRAGCTSGVKTGESSGKYYYEGSFVRPFACFE